MLEPALRQSPPLPSEPSPIVSIGAGGIVRNAHVPAYRKAGWRVASVFDLDGARARAVASDCGTDRVCASIGSADLPTSVEDAWRTMAVAEACHASSDSGATPIPK